MDWRALAAAIVAGYAAFVGLGLWALRSGPSRRYEALWLATLFAAAIGVQVAIPTGAPDEYDLTKWAYVNFIPSSSGYYWIARNQAAPDPWAFLARYPDWIRGQDSLHIGTHPPGLIVLQCILLRTMERDPALAGFLLGHMPPSVDIGFRALQGVEGLVIRRSERAALYATALMTLLCCAGTVVPLYLLARGAMPASAAWAAAALWPVMPAANLFQPIADAAYPLFSTAAWAMAVWAVRWQHGSGRHAPAALTLAAASGLVMALGMVFTLAFLPVGLIAGLLILTDLAISLRARFALILATGAGFLSFVLVGWLATGADPFVVWAWNLHHHARFYDEYHRTYWLWLWVNWIELAIAIGLPTAVWIVVGLLVPRSIPRTVWVTLFVLVLVDLTGRNMGEVARLWMLYTPPLLIAAGVGLDRQAGGPYALASTAALAGFQTLALQSLIQVVYPVSG